MAGMKANTPEETEVALEELGPDCIRIYTDGGGPGEHGDTAGWGAHAVRVHADDRAEVMADLWGPVVTDKTSVWSIGCTCGTNNSLVGRCTNRVNTAHINKYRVRFRKIAMSKVASMHVRGRGVNTCSLYTKYRWFAQTNWAFFILDLPTRLPTTRPRSPAWRRGSS